jgi:hypothetical protein
MAKDQHAEPASYSTADAGKPQQSAFRNTSSFSLCLNLVEGIDYEGHNIDNGKVDKQWDAKFAHIVSDTII